MKEPPHRLNVAASVCPQPRGDSPSPQFSRELLQGPINPYSLVVRGVCLTSVSIQCFYNDSIAAKSPDFKSAECKTVTLGQLEIFKFIRKKVEK